MEDTKDMHPVNEKRAKKRKAHGRRNKAISYKA
jgi:hypothetical protein